MAVLQEALMVAGKKLEVIWLARMSQSVRAAGCADWIDRRGDEVRPFRGERIDVWRIRRANDLAVGMIFHDHDDDVIGSRQCHGIFQRRERAGDGEEKNQSAFHHLTPLKPFWRASERSAARLA